LTYAQNCSSGSIAYSGPLPNVVINDAIENLTGGGKIFIEAGTYTFTSTPITLPVGADAAAIGSTSQSNIELYGDGNATDLVSGTNMNGVTIGVANAEGWYVHDLQIDGNRAHQSASGTGYPYSGLIGIEFYNTQQTRVERVYVHDEKTYGIHVEGGNSLILNNYLYDDLSNGINQYPGPNGYTNDLVEGNVVVGTSDVGIDCGSGYSPTVYISNVVCVGNQVSNANLGLDPWGLNSGTGISIGDTGPAKNVTVLENQVYGAIHGIQAYGYSANPNIDAQVIDNQVYDTTAGGIDAYYTTSLLIQNNLIDNSYYGIFLDKTVSGSVNVLGNSISVIGYEPISDSASNAVIENNTAQSGCNGIDAYGQHANVLDNSVSGTTCGGIILDSGSTYSVATGNTISGSKVYQGLQVYSSYDNVSDNEISVSGYGIVIGSAVDGTNVVGNNVQQAATSCGTKVQDSGRETTIENNVGYNPLGHITSPFVSGNEYILDGSGSGAPVNATTMAVWESPKLITVTVGSGWTASHTLVIKINGVVILSTNKPPGNTVVFQQTLQPGQTFYVQWQSGQATFTVSGQ